MPSTLEIAIDALRGRFLRLRTRPFEEMQEDVRVSHFTLKRFAQGKPVQEGTLRLIDAWCARQEEGQPHG